MIAICYDDFWTMMMATFNSEMTVSVIRQSIDDESVAFAARVSTLGEDSMIEEMENTGLINFLMSNRHGTPFEHNGITFFVKAPIFVWREFMRHRIGISYNEESGRYRQLNPEFYIPAPERNLVQIGKPGHYTFVPGDAGQYAIVRKTLENSSIKAYEAYERLLDQNIAREVSRMCLPVNIYSSAYVTMNARSIMSFLSLRTKREDSTFPSYPQREIEMVAEKIENYWAALMPITAAAFNKHGRVSP